jgi:CO/xanthine dehydrogenase Mo-binding subunit
MEMPSIEIRHVETPSPFTPLGMKGIGESGLGSCLGALCNAIEDAFPELDLVIDELILTPNNVWRAIQNAQPREPAAV